MYYIFLLFLIFIILAFLIIKIKYRFWSIQPVFHYYNIFYWIYPPGVINKEMPKINRYVNLLSIKTAKAADYTDIERDKIVFFIQQYYLRNKDAEYIPDKKVLWSTYYIQNMRVIYLHIMIRN